MWKRMRIRAQPSTLDIENRRQRRKENAFFWAHILTLVLVHSGAVRDQHQDHTQREKGARSCIIFPSQRHRQRPPGQILSTPLGW